MKVKDQYYPGKKIWRGVKIETDIVAFEAYPGQYEDVLTNLSMPTPKTKSDYNKIVKSTWGLYPQVLGIVRNYWAHSATLNINSSDSPSFNYPDWLHRELTKRWECEPTVYDERITADHFNGTGVYVMGAVNTLLTWEQWQSINGIETVGYSTLICPHCYSGLPVRAAWLYGQEEATYWCENCGYEWME